MAYVTIEPVGECPEIDFQHALTDLRIGLTKLGVSEIDCLLRIVENKTSWSSENPHAVVTVVTDNIRVTAEQVVKILASHLQVPFEVSRLYVGYLIPELVCELVAFFRQNRRNWASTY